MKTFLFILILSFSQIANSAILVISSDGRLMGATNIGVSGKLYDVSFFGGSCIELFNGCNELSDFQFSTLDAAETASQALLDQVFLGTYDDLPLTTNGCTSFTCITRIPYAINTTGVLWGGAWNESMFSGGVFYDHTTNGWALNTNYGSYARWTIVPIPSTVYLFISALIALVGKKRW